MRILLVAALTFISLIGSASLAAQTSGDQTNALQADTDWLHFIDAGDYPDAWKTAAKGMQDAMPETNFAKAMSGARNPLGTLTTRTLSNVQSKTKLPGAPDGHYVIAQYSAHFANKANGIETVVASQAADGSWHVTGYFIR